MVQLFYYENRGRCARRILRHDLTASCGSRCRWTASGGSSSGSSSSSSRGSDGCRVMLYPDEGWARPAGLSYLLLQPVWWSRTRCRVVELCGTRRANAMARMTVAAGNGSHVIVVGKFKDATTVTPSNSSAAASTASGVSAPTETCPAGVPSCLQEMPGRYFKLTLSTDVTNADFQLGYCMTGTMERGDRKSGPMEMTHYAMVKRKGY